jgi:hypothetical protein
MTQISKNLLLISGSGRNVGKTSFIREVIAQNASQNVIAVKITPHFHEATSGLISVAVTYNYRIFQETDSRSAKDSSLFLKAGAEKVFYIQTNDIYLEEAFQIVLKQVKPDQPIVTESAALRNYFTPGLSLFIQKKNEEVKSSAIGMQKLADATVYSDGEQFSLNPKSITFNQTWKINDIS